MKLLLMIDHFGSGGAQTQLVILARGLKERGHDVAVFSYHRGHDFKRPELVEAGVTLFDAPDGANFFGRIKFLSVLLKAQTYDAVISFLKTPNLLNTITGIICRQQRIIVSERSSHFNDKGIYGERLRRQLHRFADHVVTNSPDHANWLSANFPLLRSKVTTILNGYEVVPLPPALEKNDPRDLRLVAVGRITALKKADTLITALALVHRRRGFIPAVTWVGRRDMHGPDSTYAKELDKLLARHPEVAVQWAWAGQRMDVAALIAEHHLLVHPALHEGFSNALCEALMLGRPILAGSVCDHPFLTGAGKRGEVYDVTSTIALADKIEHFMDMSALNYSAQCREARIFAAKHLTVDRMVTEYENLLTGL